MTVIGAVERGDQGSGFSLLTRLLEWFDDQFPSKSILLESTSALFRGCVVRNCKAAARVVPVSVMDQKP